MIRAESNTAVHHHLHSLYLRRGINKVSLLKVHAAEVLVPRTLLESFGVLLHCSM